MENNAKPVESKSKRRRKRRSQAKQNSVLPASSTDGRGRLRISNLPPSCTKAQLKSLIKEYSPVRSIILPRKEINGIKILKGFAKIIFAQRTDAERVMEELQNQVFEGYELKIQSVQSIQGEDAKDEPVKSEIPSSTRRRKITKATGIPLAGRESTDRGVGSAGEKQKNEVLSPKPQLRSYSNVAAQTRMPNDSKSHQHDVSSKPGHQTTRAKINKKKPGFWKQKKEKEKAEVEEHFGEKSHLEILQEFILNLLPEEDVPDTVRKCLRLLDPIHINIFDYVAKNFHLIFDNIDDLIARCEALKASADVREFGAGVGYYPLNQAKQEGFRNLLRSLFYGRRRIN
eukprot:gene2692-2866_t